MVREAIGYANQDSEFAGKAEIGYQNHAQRDFVCSTQHSNQAELDDLRARNANSQENAPEWKSNQVLHESRTSNLPVSSLK